MEEENRGGETLYIGNHAGSMQGQRFPYVDDRYVGRMHYS